MRNIRAVASLILLLPKLWILAQYLLAPFGHAPGSAFGSRGCWFLPRDEYTAETGSFLWAVVHWLANDSEVGWWLIRNLIVCARSTGCPVLEFLGCEGLAKRPTGRNRLSAKSMAGR
jgi:hypothetical protein